MIMPKKIDPGKLTPDTLALLLSNAGQRRISEEQVRQIAEAGDLISVDGTINLVSFTAFLALEAEGSGPETN